MSRLGNLLRGRQRAASEDGEKEQVQQLPIARIDRNPYQPREVFDDEALAALRASIEVHGILQPIVVRPAEEEGRYQLVAGERRLQAAKALGWEHVPAIIRTVGNQELAELALIENLQREDLHFLEEARAYQRLVEEFGLTQRELAERVGKGQSTVANKLRLLQLAPKVQEIVRERGLSERHARALLQLEGAEAQEEAARIIADRGMTVREAEAWIARRKERAQQAKQRRVWILKDVRLFLNGIQQLVKQVQSSGIPVEWEQEQDGDWIEVRLRINRKGNERRG
ncbi:MULTISPECIES: ParB/RepB/Spo0J family partition protein [Limnochorda]|mgnify:FL=1|uniref:ParB/RepB/Spo0J family partition protein n=1 Tax=Limnochorda TaxID=1676651 RepID=UPI0026EDA5B7|nr:ParB/RepB/Spo0J family partition protein [Limnochorda pilosa]